LSIGMSTVPPSARREKSASASRGVSTNTKNEMLGSIVKCGPPFSAVKRWPAISSSTVRTLPRGLPLGLSPDSG
jgi:hypothetical protein